MLKLLSSIGIYCVLIGSFFFILRYTIFRFKKLNKVILNKFYLNDILSIIFSIIIVLIFF